MRVRFCPSPTGTPHVGLIRTALFNWAYARHTGGTFVFRIEDTDAARDSQESYEQLLDALRWLGLDWDEGVEVGGPHEPYRQSQRSDLYTDVVRRLVEGGYAYESFSTPEEIEARHKAAGRDPKLGYDGADRDLTDEQKTFFRAEGREPTLRLRMPDDDITFTDLVRGEITFQPGSVPDFVIVRANGQPLYTLVNPVDDALMGITHVLRGEDLLSSTPRQIALYRALLELGVATVMPVFGHLPSVLGEGNKKLSKREPEAEPLPAPRPRLHARGAAQLPRAARLVDRPGPRHLHDGRDDGRVRRRRRQPEPGALRPEEGRGHQLGAHPDAGARRLPRPPGAVPAPRRHRARGLVRGPRRREHRALLDAGAPLIQERITLLGEAEGMLGFLFVADDALEIADDARAALRDETPAVLDASLAALAALPADGFTTEATQAALQAALVDEGGLALKPRFAFTPLRVALSGRRISPPLFESMEILGRDATLARLTALREAV